MLLMLWLKENPTCGGTYGLFVRTYFTLWLVCQSADASELIEARVTHICISRLTITGSDNGLSPGWRQAIIWTNAGILLIGPLRTNFSEHLIAILTFSFMKMLLKVSSVKWGPFCLGLNVLIMHMSCMSFIHHILFYNKKCEVYD